jgi:hypothetical protein
MPTFTIEPFAGGVSATPDADLPKLVDYLYSLCGKYAFQAENILGTVGGVVINPSSGGNSALIYHTLNHVITAGEANVSTYQNNDLIGADNLVQVVIRQSEYQLGQQFTFNSVTGTLNFALSGYVLQEGDPLTTSYTQTA